MRRRSWLNGGWRVRTALVVAAAGLLTARSAPAQSSRAAGPDELRSRLETVLKTAENSARVGICVRNVADGAVWFEHAPDEPLKPASVLKLFATAAALERFGPEFAFETRAYERDGELWIIGAGDPALGDERLAERDHRARHALFDDLAAALKARGVTSLRKLVLDDGVFDQEWRHADWPADQSDRWYQAPVGGLNYNDNCVDLRADVRGKQVIVSSEPPLPDGFLRNALRVGARQAPVAKRAPESDLFELAGVLKRSESLGPVSANRPTVFFGHAVCTALRARGIDVADAVVRRTIGDDDVAGQAPLLVARTPLRDVLWRCNVFSQNLFAEALSKALAAYEPSGRRGDRPGSWAAGTETTRTTLAKLGIDLRGAVLRDGSGLSHDNRATAGQIAALLVAMHRHPHADVFRASLAAAGEEGSMRRRYAADEFRGRLIGKTGSISGVQTLAGYARRDDGTTVAFAILVNGEAGELLVKLARVLVQSPG